MKLFITGICGFVGSSFANWFHEHRPSFKISGIDDFARPGSEINRSHLRSRGITVQHADIRNASAFLQLIGVIDAAANPSVVSKGDYQKKSSEATEG